MPHDSFCHGARSFIAFCAKISIVFCQGLSCSQRRDAQGQKVRKMCIFRTFSALCRYKKASKDCSSKVFYYAVQVSRFCENCDGRLCTGTVFVMVQGRLSLFLQTFLSCVYICITYVMFIYPTILNGSLRKNLSITRFFSSMLTEKDPEGLLLQGLVYAIGGWPAMQN